MPELPEVETTLRGIKPFILRQKITGIVVRHPHLRWPIPPQLSQLLIGQKLNKLNRRGKYILFEFETGTLILHLGMSGSLRVLPQAESARKHDHVDLCFKNGICLRFTDPRRFGALLYTTEAVFEHPLLAALGPEPLAAEFNADYLADILKNKKRPIKSLIMDGHVVVGVGNIYAAEALFLARLHPQTPSGKLSAAQCQKLVQAIKKVLAKAITKGGTTLKDFTQSDGKPGYFSTELKVYGRAGKACKRCHTTLKVITMSNRQTVYCPACQKR